MDPAESGEILVFQHITLRRGYPQLLGKPICAQPISKAVAHRFDMGSLVSCDPVNRDVIHQ